MFDELGFNAPQTLIQELGFIWTRSAGFWGEAGPGPEPNGALPVSVIYDSQILVEPNEIGLWSKV